MMVDSRSLFAGTDLRTPLSEKELEEIEAVYRFDRSYEKIRNKRIVKEGMKFKKLDLKLQVIAFAKTVKAPSSRGSPSETKRDRTC